MLTITLSPDDANILTDALRASARDIQATAERMVHDPLFDVLSRAANHRLVLARDIEATRKLADIADAAQAARATQGGADAP